MGEASSDYFANHALKLRFPWSLYHKPLVRAVAEEIARDPGRRVLNVGSGPFSELPHLPPDREYFACDIDPRAVDAVRELHGSLVDAAVSEPDAPLPYEAAEFDIVFACDVIEHVPAPLEWTADLARVLKPGGRLILTTPNYGFSTLSLIESTLLELIARRNGFSRRDIHPSKLDRRSLDRILQQAGLTDRRVRKTSLSWVLVGSALKPHPDV